MISNYEQQYIQICKDILKNGYFDNNRTGTPTYKLPHQILQFDLAEEFPILTTKQVAFKHAVLEMLWIYQVQSNDVSWLKDRGIKIWNEWEIGEDGTYMGKNFGKEWARSLSRCMY